MHALDNWSNISRLELNTEFLRVRQFSGTMAKFKNRLKHLKFTHFTEPLDNQRVEDLGRGLARLSNLELLEMDWEMTNHRDGLVAQQVSQLLSRMLPSLRRFVYTVPIDAYFEDIAEEASGNQANLLPSPLSAGPVNQLSHGTLPEGVPIQLLSSSLSRSFPILRLRSGHSTRMSSRSGATTREPNDGLLSPSSPSATTSSNPRKQKESEYFGILKGIEGLSHLFPVDITVLWSVD